LVAAAVRDAIKSKGCAVIGTATIVHDVTELRQRYEAAQHLAAVVEFSGEAIISSTLDGTITNWHPAAERL
jgi:PAS domain-containing protein